LYASGLAAFALRAGRDVHTILEFLKSLYSDEGLKNLIHAGGYLGLIGIVFAETGLLIGFFLPGDSLLVTAGIFTTPEAVGGQLFDLFPLMAVLIVAAIVGDQLNYAMGRKTGEVVYSRPDSRFIKRKHFEQARDFYLTYGASAIVLARFVPILRTFVPFVAGVAQMPYRRFVTYNIVGGVSWVSSMLIIGHFIGQTPLASDLKRVIIVVVFISLIPLFVGAFKQWRAARRAGSAG
jgi:membrane-associated protein